MPIKAPWYSLGPLLLLFDPCRQLRPRSSSVQPLDPEQGWSGRGLRGWVNSCRESCCGCKPHECAAWADRIRRGREAWEATMLGAAPRANIKGSAEVGVEGRRREEESERGLGQTLQRPLWLMPGLICVATKPSDDAIAGPRAKSAPIQIKMEVFPCTSTVRKILWVFDWSLSTLQVKVLGHPLTLLLDESQWGGKGTGNGFSVISVDGYMHGAFLKYTTGETELTLFFVKFIQVLCLHVWDSVYFSSNVHDYSSLQNAPMIIRLITHWQLSWQLRSTRCWRVSPLLTAHNSNLLLLIQYARGYLHASDWSYLFLVLVLRVHVPFEVKLVLNSCTLFHLKSSLLIPPSWGRFHKSGLQHKAFVAG